MKNWDVTHRDISISKYTPLDLLQNFDCEPHRVEMDVVAGHEINVEMAGLVHTFSDRNVDVNGGFEAPYGAYMTLHITWQGHKGTTHAMNTRADVYPMLCMPEHVTHRGHMWLPSKAQVETIPQLKIQIQLGNSKSFVIGPESMYRYMLGFTGLPSNTFNRVSSLRGIHDAVVFLLPGWVKSFGREGQEELQFTRNKVFVLDM